MKTKQTAVEWYSIQIIDLTIQLLEGKISQIQYAMKKVIMVEQAKEMEKDQQKVMFNCGRQYQLTGEGTFKQTYEELYGQRND